MRCLQCASNLLAIRKRLETLLLYTCEIRSVYTRNLSSDAHNMCSVYTRNLSSDAHNHCRNIISDHYIDILPSKEPAVTTSEGETDVIATCEKTKKLTKTETSWDADK